MEGPLVAQRLANGHTFLATKDRLFKVDRAGKETFSYRRPDGTQFMRAVKLADGTIACVTQSQLYLPSIRPARNCSASPCRCSPSAAGSTYRPMAGC